MPEEPLYEDEQIKIDYDPRSVEGHLLNIKTEKKVGHIYYLDRGILEEFARTPRGGLVGKLNAVNDLILFSVERAGIGIDGLHVALCQAYAEEERRIQEDRLKETI